MGSSVVSSELHLVAAGSAGAVGGADAGELRSLDSREWMLADGGRGWDRTSDPYDVNVVLSR
jgi:hypothetical protein